MSAATGTIAPAEPRHVDPAWTLLERSRDALAAAGIRQWDDAYPTRATVEDDVRRGTLFVLALEGRCVASITLDDRQDPQYASVAWEGSEPALVVHRLCVDPAERGRGHASRLMDFAEAHAAERGFASIRLDAYSGNARSLEIYRARGYREAGTVFFPRRTLHFFLFERTVGR